MLAAATVLLAAGCGGGSAPAAGAAATAAGGVYLCPAADPFAVYAGRTYPPNYPAPPPKTRRPARCFASARAAARAGDAVAPPPPGAQDIGGVYLVPAAPSLERLCRRAASRAGFTVLCPRLVPGAGDEVFCSAGAMCVGRGSFVLEGSFAGPPGYVGAAPGQGHLWVIAYTGGSGIWPRDTLAGGTGAGRTSPCAGGPPSGSGRSRPAPTSTPATSSCAGARRDDLRRQPARAHEPQPPVGARDRPAPGAGDRVSPGCGRASATIPVGYRDSVRIAALYDIHGNVPALEAVLADVRASGAELVVVGGDVAGGPQPVESMEMLESLDLPARFVRGNCDRAPDAFEAKRLDATRLARLAAWPLTVAADVEELGEVLFCHASPRSDEDLVTAISPDDRLAPMFAGVTQAVVVCGHVHVQFDRRAAGHRIVNAGSVGMAYEGRPDLACWCLLGPDVELRADRIRPRAVRPGADRRRLPERRLVRPRRPGGGDGALRAAGRRGRHDR